MAKSHFPFGVLLLTVFFVQCIFNSPKESTYLLINQKVTISGTHLCEECENATLMTSYYGPTGCSFDDPSVENLKALFTFEFLEGGGSYGGHYGYCNGIYEFPYESQSGLLTIDIVDEDGAAQIRYESGGSRGIKSDTFSFTLKAGEIWTTSSSGIDTSYHNGEIYANRASHPMQSEEEVKTP